MATVTVAVTGPVIVAADLDRDGDVDAADAGLFGGCVTGPAIPHDGTPICVRADLHLDGDVDLVDFGILQRCYSGSDNPPDPDCAN